MRARPRAIRALLIASVAVCAIAGPLPNICVTPAAAQAASLSVEFRTALEPYGAWQHHRRWGEVWIPSRVARDWKPYTVGHGCTPRTMVGTGLPMSRRPIGAW
jgi:hypothetical protein